MTAPTLLDARGCLTEAGIDALAGAPGLGPADLVAHLGRCARCQERVLARSAGHQAGAPRVRKQAPPLWRTLVVALAALLMLAAALFVTYRLG